MCKLCWGMLAVLILLLAGGVYRFGFKGSTLPAQDGRVVIPLTGAERDLVLAEMRSFLGSVQAITQALVDQDMPALSRAARSVGMAAQRGVPLSLMGKLPMEFKRLGMDTHRKFDQVALDAEQLGDAEQSLMQLSQLMQNCVGCHAVYRFAAPDHD